MGSSAQGEESALDRNVDSASVQMEKKDGGG